MKTLVDPAEGESDLHEVCALPGGKGFVFVVHETGGGFGKISLVTADGERRDVVSFDSGNVYDPYYSNT